MHQRRIVVGTLVLGALGAAACSDDNGAGPAIDQRNTGSIQVLVKSDTGNLAGLDTTRTTYGFRSGVNVTVRPVDDPLVLRRLATVSGGKVVFRGLPVGDYVVKPVVRPNTVFFGPESVIVHVDSGVVDSTIAFKFRQGGRIAGFISIQYFDQTGFHIERFPAGKIVTLLEDTAAVQTVTSPRLYKPIFVDTTDAGGNYELFGTPTTHHYGVAFESGMTTRSDSLRLTVDTLQSVRNALVTLNQSTGIIGGSVSLNPTFGFQSRLAGRVFRDYNSNGVFDSTATANERLIAGDTVQIQLRNGAGDRVLQTQRVLSTTGAQSYVFSSLAPGDYKLTLARATSRFASPPAFVPRDTTISVTIPTTKSRVTQFFPLQPTP